MKKILFIYRHSALKKIHNSDGSTTGPTEFLWGMNYFDKDKSEIKYINAPREEKRKGIRKITWFLEFPFSKLVRIGFPIEIYQLYKSEIKWADEIVCVNDPISMGVLFWKLMGKLENKKVHCIIMSVQERVKYFKWCWPAVRFVSKLLSKASNIVTLSDFVKDDFAKDYKLDREKLKTMYFGIDTTFWFPLNKVEKENFILSVGNDMNRDFQTLIDALPDDMELRLVTKKKVDTRNKKIDIISGITDEELRILYNKARFVVVPSIKLKNESSGLSCCLQAMACKTPVIISDAPPLREMFEDGIDCLFYKAENTGDLNAKIRLLLSNQDLQHNLAKNGYKKATEFYTSKKMGERLEYIVQGE